MKTVLLSGCGNIGFRHLQALCAMAVPVEIFVVEPNAELHDRIRGQFTEAADSGHRFELLSSLPTEPGYFDLAVVATTAMRRRAVVEQILAHHDVAVMILEKVLFQTAVDLHVVANLLERRNVAAFVNCGRRTFPGYQSILAALGDDRPVDLSVRGQRFGLASNAIHFLDLAEYLNGATLTDLDTTGLDPGSQPGRRPGVVEIFGTLTGHLDNGARLDIESVDVDPMVIEVTIAGRSTAFTVDELARTVASGDGDAVFESQNVSETPELYRAALDTQSCVLTPYADSARQHRLYLRAVNAHLGLPATDDVPCPVS